MGWQAVVLWLVGASVADVVVGDLPALGVLALLGEAGRVLTEAVPAVPTGVLVVGRAVVLPPVVACGVVALPRLVGSVEPGGDVELLVANVSSVSVCLGFGNVVGVFDPVERKGIAVVVAEGGHVTP